MIPTPTPDPRATLLIQDLSQLRPALGHDHHMVAFDKTMAADWSSFSTLLADKPALQKAQEGLAARLDRWFIDNGLAHEVTAIVPPEHNCVFLTCSARAWAQAEQALRLAEWDNPKLDPLQPS